MAKTWLLITLLVALATPSLLSGALNIERVEEKRVPTVPKVDWAHLMDAASGYFGVIVDNNRAFQLYRKTGWLSFETRAKEPSGYFIVNMRRNPGSILLGLSNENGSKKRYEVYDYDGKRIVRPFKAKNLIRSSPAGAYFYSALEFGNDKGRPQVFDRLGKSLVTFKTRAGCWKMTAVDDSTLILQDDMSVEVLDIPRMSVRRAVTLDSDLLFSTTIYTAVSRDGSTYASTAYGVIAVVDLRSGATVYVPPDTTVDVPSSDQALPLPPQVGLSYRGRFLIAWFSSTAGHILNIYQRTDSSYEAVLEGHFLPEEFGGMLSSDAHFIGGSYCALDFFDSNGELPRNRTFLFRLPDTLTTELDWQALEGFVSFDESMDPRENVFRLNATYPCVTSVVRIKEDL